VTAALLPSGRAVEDMDLAAAVSLARQFVADRSGSQSDDHACRVIRQLLQHMDGAIERAHGPLLFDRGLVADVMRHPGKYRSDVVLAQAALVHGTLGEDTPMAAPYLADRRRPVLRPADEE
jgi:hypothetical protein